VLCGGGPETRVIDAREILSGARDSPFPLEFLKLCAPTMWAFVVPDEPNLLFENEG
jgi:hypothetical protein